MAIFFIIINGTAYGGDLRIYCPEGPPTNYTAEDGSVTGFTTDIVREIQKRVGDDSEIETYPWKRAYGIALSEPNVVLFTASRNADRDSKFHWVTQVTTRRSVFFSKADSPLKIYKMEDAKLVTSIGVLRGGNRAKFLTRNNFANIAPVNQKGQNIRKLLAGRVDLIFMSTLEAASEAKLCGVPFDKIEPRYTVFTNDSYIVMSKNGTPVETAIRWIKAARQLKDDGTFRKISEKWIRHIRKTYAIETEVKDNVLVFWKD